MSNTVVGVGHCGFDSSRIAAVVEKAGGVFEGVSSGTQALARVKRGDCALVLPNRVIGGDEAGGRKVVEALQADPETAGVPVMLVSDLPEAQQQAEAAGAQPGFGKSALEADETVARIRTFLTS